MKYLTTSFLVALLPLLVFAQVVDDSNISKIQEGNYSLEKGKLQVTFSDTVSPDFIEQELEKMGYKILSSNFRPIMLRVTNIPEAITMKDLEDNKWVEFIMSESAGIEDEDLEEINKEDSTNDLRVNQMLAQLNHPREYEYIMLGLTYSATESAIAEILSIHPDLEIEISEKSERSAVIETEIDKEVDAMDELKKLAYVKSTAMIGSIE